MPQFMWGSGPASLVFCYDENHPVRVSASTPLRLSDEDAPRAMVEILIAGEGRALTNTRSDRTQVSERLRFVEKKERLEEGAHRLDITQQDPVSGLAVVTSFIRPVGLQSVRVSTRLTHEGGSPLTVQMVSSLALSGLTGFLGPATSTRLWTARNEWCGESRWSAVPLKSDSTLIDIHPRIHGQAQRGMFALQSTSTWSSGEYVPVAALENTDTAHTVIWQMEVNGPWRWEINAQERRTDWYSLMFQGPDDLHHNWLKRLEPGQSFETVPVSLAFSTEGLDDAVGQLTRHRRLSHIPTSADQDHPLVFNDYMNALMGDPTTERLLPLIDAAARAGAQRFCIDAGWYDDGGDWWDSVGAWQPSSNRFGEEGLLGVLDYIRSRGMEPGLWIEAEVIGVKSPLAQTLPEDAFMHRGGVRIVEHGRYLLDMRSASARHHLDETFQRLVEQYGVTYFKWDYNVTPGVGPDTDAAGAGDGLLEHARAHLAWVRTLRERYPQVIIEACSSGAQRMDPAILAHYDLQSTTDQQDYRLYPTIAASAPMTMAPEQAGNWSYPHGGMDLEQIAFNMVTGLSGRLYLSGHLNQMSPEQMALIREGTALYPEVIRHQAAAVPLWPLGLPTWESPVVVLATESEEQVLVYVWKRNTSVSGVTLPLLSLAGRQVSAEVAYPAALEPWTVTWMPDSSCLDIDFEASGESARIIRLTKAPLPQA